MERFDGATVFATLVTISSVALCLNLTECNRPLGLEFGRITDEQLSASSSHDLQSTGPQNARIRNELGSGAWCPQRQINTETKEWLQIDFAGPTVISAIETQGRYDGGRGMEYPPSYMLEYWRKSLGSWARYKDYTQNEVIPGNTDTRSSVLRVLDGGILAEKIRIIPVSEATRTVCMRLEIYGCSFKESLLSYSIPDGNIADGLNMRDYSYDGRINASGTLVNGIGKLFDGVTGEDNFEKHPKKWIGWRKDLQGPTIWLEFTFSEQRNISAIYFHTSNFLKHRAQVFETADLLFSQRGNNLFSSRTVHFEYVADHTFSGARWVRIPIPNRLARKVKVQLRMAHDADWLLLSEVRFESGNAPFSFVYEENDEAEAGQTTNNESKFKLFSINDPLEEKVYFHSSALIGCLICVFAALILFIALVCCCRKPITVKSSSPVFNKTSKDVQLMILDGDTIKRFSPSTYRMAVDNLENSLLEKLPVCSDSGSEYADPDCSLGSGGRSSVPLLGSTSPPVNNGHSVHYAASDILQIFPFSKNSTPNSTLDNPLSSSSKYRSYRENNIDGAINLVEIDFNALQFREPLGQSEYGEVHLCQLEQRYVAVKMLRLSATQQEEVDFKHEIKVLSRLRHQNIVELVGVCSNQKPLCCILEYMQNGDLRQFLQKQPNHSMEVLLSISTQIAAGMSYLESLHFVHRDLAARNCYVSADGTVKISDFGMARNLYSSDYYKTQGPVVLPIRWMAWESLLLGKFTTKTDVWSFGVTIWEVLNGCQKHPYSDLLDPQVIENLQCIFQNRQLKVYLDIPQYCTSLIYNQILLPCWQRDEQQRPTFQTLHRQLQNILCSQFSGTLQASGVLR